MNNNTELLTNLNKILAKIPPDMAAEAIDFLRKWLPIIVQMSTSELQTLTNHIKAKEIRKAMGQLLEKGIELNSSKYLLNEASAIIDEWKESAEYNHQVHEMVKNGAEIALKILAAILVAAL